MTSKTVWYMKGQGILDQNFKVLIGEINMDAYKQQLAVQLFTPVSQQMPFEVQQILQKVPSTDSCPSTAEQFWRYADVDITEVLPCCLKVKDSTPAAIFLNIITGRGLLMSSIESVCFSECFWVRNNRCVRSVSHGRGTV